MKNMVLTLVFEKFMEPNFTLRLVVEDMGKAKELVRHHKKSTKAKLVQAYVTVLYDID